MQHVPVTDPVPPRWDELALPPAWPDGLRPWRPRDAWRFLRKAILGRVGPVVLPADLPLNVAIPKYVLQELHNLPNGNYSRTVTQGYGRGFDVAMLGTLHGVRREIAETLRGARSALDLGCGAGHLARALRDAGIDDVWGLDASPYLLQHAARAHRDVRFVQGLAEETRFPADRFDAVAACFLFHELPPRACDAALREIHRVLVPGGTLAIAEPSREQWTGSPGALLRRHGWRGLYFRTLARFVHEPFAESWHRHDVPAWLDAHGFVPIEERDRFPTRIWIARTR